VPLRLKNQNRVKAVSVRRLSVEPAKAVEEPKAHKSLSKKGGDKAASTTDGPAADTTEGELSA